MDEDEMPDESTLATAAIDIESTVAVSLIADAVKLNQITQEEGDFLKEKYKKLFELNETAKSQDQYLTRRIKVLEADILSDKILLEKARIEESDEQIRVQRAGESRNALQKELEEVEQKDTMVKFELFELKKVHDELQKSLATMKKQNNQMVEPVLERLKRETEELNEQYLSTEDAFERDCVQKKNVELRLSEVQALKEERALAYQQKLESFHATEAEPARLQRQIAAIVNASDNMKQDLQALTRKLNNFENTYQEQKKRKLETEKMRTNILEKLELNRQTLEDREHDVQAVQANLEKAKALSHDLITRKVELNVKKRELDSNARHINDQLNVATKDYEGLTRQLKKKVIVLDLVKQNIPGLEGQLRDQELSLKNIQDDKSSRKKEIQKLKDEIEVHITKLFSQENIESERKKELENIIEEVEELEGLVAEALAENKKQHKLLSVLSAQRDIKSRENARIESKDKEAKQQVRMKELTILDLTKRCNEITNRLKEFSALYEVVKNERNKYVNLIQSSAQALAEMREKIRILQNEVEILSNERAAKDLALTKERNAHQQAQNQRDSLRQDLNRLLSEYRSRQGTVEQQIQEIDKLNVVINSLEKEMLLLKTRYEHAVEERNVTGVQLIDRNDELCILYERSNQQQETLRKGELEIIKLEEEIRLLRLYTEELNRKYLVAKHRVPYMHNLQEEIKKLKLQLEKEQKLTEELSQKLEDPKNLERWRPLEGSDPDIEQLISKIQVLESRLDKKREIVLEKELILEEITTLTEKLRNQAVTKRENAKLLADELNDLHGKIRDITKKMLASVSELSMYQATALRLQQEKLKREKLLEDAQWRITHGEAPTNQAEVLLQRTERIQLQRQEMAAKRALELPLQGASGQYLRTAAEPRPTAYIPDEIGIPKPYGNLAPFKPTETGSTMRHIRPPQIKPVEI